MRIRELSDIAEPLKEWAEKEGMKFPNGSRIDFYPTPKEPLASYTPLYWTKSKIRWWERVLLLFVKSRAITDPDEGIVTVFKTLRDHTYILKQYQLGRTKLEKDWLDEYRYQMRVK